MILEELMHERFATYSFFKDQMAVYAGLPAVFTREHRTIGKKVGKENSTRESCIRLICRQMKRGKAQVLCR